MRTRPDAISELAVGDKVVHLDEHGYVIDPEEWDEATAEELARRQNIQLTNDHWDVIRFMREFLAELNVKVRVSVLAKWKTTLQMLALAVLLAGPSAEKFIAGAELTGIALLWIAAVLTLWTGYDYLKAGIKHAMSH